MTTTSTEEKAVRPESERTVALREKGGKSKQIKIAMSETQYRRFRAAAKKAGFDNPTKFLASLAEPLMGPLAAKK